MPYLKDSSYKPPFWLMGGHLQTMYPVLFRKKPKMVSSREILSTPDGDRILLDIALAENNGRSKDVAILSHGLEGDSRRKYILGMGRAFLKRGVDVVARNFRCCGGEMNALPGMYHSGQTEDIQTVVNFCLKRGYKRIFLLGFSMGGNQVLKYLGEPEGRLPVQIAGAVVFSVPCDLTGCAKTLDMPSNRVYMEYFLRSLRVKIREKNRLYPELYPLQGLDDMKTFAEFDNRYTAPVHGFTSAADYWEKASSLPFLHKITVPTLLVNAKNDPFLSESCFPVALAKSHEHLFFEMPGQGGHVGFVPRHGSRYWSERRAVQFLLQGSYHS